MTTRFRHNKHVRLERLHHTLTTALPYAGSRQLAGGATVQELQLEAAFALEMEPVLVDLYRYPLRDGGLSELPDDEAAALAWLLARYGEPQATRRLEDVLNRYALGAFDVGGNMALSEMGVSGTFRLRDEALLAGLAAFVAVSLVATDGDFSLTRTTARDLARWTSRLRDDPELTDADVATALGERVPGRALSRSAAIAENETVRFSRHGMAVTYERNGLNQVIHRSLPGACTICAPRDGLVYNVVSGVVVGDDIPLHVSCRCYHEPAVNGQPLVETDWTPEEGRLWTGG